MDNTTTPAQASSELEQASQSAQGSGASIATPQTPSGTSGSPDVQAGAPNTPPQTPQTPQQPQGGSQDSSNPEAVQSAADAKTSLSKAPTGAPSAAAPNPAAHPAVQKAGVIRDIAQTLAGGPNTSYTIDPNTGTMVATKQPLSTKQIGMAIAMAALTGGISGLGEKGPGAEGRAAKDGFDAVAQQQAQQKQQAQVEASQNYARQAAIANTNFQTHQNALRLSQMEYDYHKQFVGAAEPVLKNINDVGAALESGVREGDLTSKYHVTKDMAIPDGIVENGKNPDGSTHWENTYTVIDPNKKIELPEETSKLLADLRVPGYFTMKDGKAVPQNFSGSAPIKAGLVVNGLALAQGFQITEGQLNRQFANLKGGDKDASEFDANLKQAIAKGNMTVKGLQTIGNYANMPLDKAVAAMEKDKVDPAVIQQYRSLVPADAIEQSKLQSENEEADRKAAEARKTVVITPKNAEDIINAAPGLYTPDQVASAKQVQKSADSHDLMVAATKAGAESAARTQAEINVKVKNGIPIKGAGPDAQENLTHPQLASLVEDPNNYKTPTHTNEAFLNSMMQIDPERAKLIKAYSEGMDVQSYYAAVKQFGGSLAADIHAYDPTFNASKMREYDKVQTDFGPNGKLGMANKAASTTFKHLYNLNQSIGIGSALNLNGDYTEHLSNAISEMGNAYANGHKAGEAELADQRKALASPIPAKAKPATVAAATDLMEKVKSDYDSYDDALPLGIKRQGLIDADGANAYRKLTGKPVDVKLIKAPRGATGTAPDSKGVLYYHDEAGNVLGKVPGQ